MSIDAEIATIVEEVVRKALDERLAPIVEQLARLTPGPAKPQSDNDELSLRQIKDQYDYAPSTVRRWIDAGDLKAKKGAKEWRVRRGDLKVKIGHSKGNLSVVDFREKAEKILARGGQR